MNSVGILEVRAPAATDEGSVDVIPVFSIKAFASSPVE